MRLLVIDYTKEDPVEAIRNGSVAVSLDTKTQAAQCLPLMKPEISSIVPIPLIPSGKLTNSAIVKGGEPVSKMTRTVLDGTFAYHSWRAVRARTNHSYMFPDLNDKDLTMLAGLVKTGTLRPVVGSVVPFDDIEAVKRAM